MPPVSTTDYPRETPVVDLKSGIVTEPWDHFFQAQASLAALVNTIIGQNLFALAAQPSLGAGDAGYIGWVTDYGHAVRWTGTIWQFAPGDTGNGFISDRMFAPQEVGWQLCDGTVSTYLVVGGATLTTAALATPNLTGTAAYRKSAAAYTGVINAASGSTGGGTTGTGTSGAGTAHHHTQNHTEAVAAGGPGAPIVAAGGLSLQVTIVGNVDDEAAHTHSVPGLSVPNLAVGTIDMPNVGMLPYARR